MINKLNAGCRKYLKEGWLNIDIRKPYDIKVDLDKTPYPFEDNMFNYILLDNVLEHLNNPVECLEELHRICSSKGTIEIIVPFYSSPNAFRDMTHQSFFNLDSLNEFDINKEEKIYNLSFKRFVISKKLHPSKIGRFIPKPLLNIFALSIGNLIDEITFKLKPVKENQNDRKEN